MAGPRTHDEEPRRDREPDPPRTDLPPEKRPYDEDYFGTGEEEGVVRERQADAERPQQTDTGRPQHDERGRRR